MSDEGRELQVWQPSPFENGTDLLPTKPMLPTKSEDLVGRESIEASDLVLPTLACLQGLSDPVAEGWEGAKPGRFFLSTTGDIMEGPIRVLLVHHSRSRALFPKADHPRHQGLKVCLSRDGVEGTEYGLCESCEHRTWGEDGSAPPCAESHNFVAMTPYGPAIIRFARTSFKPAKTLLTNWTLSPKPLWAHPCIIKAKARTKELQGKQVTYYVMDIRWEQREDVPPKMQEAARALFDQVAAAHEQGRLASDQEDVDPDPNSAWEG